ncbi:uncharacterized protein LOC116215088 isoform X2 [Punica granatum]|uniref:Uncharacterized protein LOC116215088 isoform X2 n=2 Tax=Punica granatum TaxID=22663 RepID=A0A6P8EIJ7_PUNGR|nr:uncharacterized protein LOC116215088 isoform X2 [Punica granatum]
MGCRNGGELPYGEEASFSDALLFATMCIIGLPVDVHARDGSVYSGIFHTASVEGVVLKKAKMTKKGGSNSNVAIGCMVEMLVILSSELVQVVAKGVSLPADGVAGTIAGDELESALGTVSSHHADRVGSKCRASTISKKRTYKKRTSVQTENGFTHGDTDTSKLTLPRVNGNEGQWVLKHDMRSTTEEESDAKGVTGVNDKVEDVSAPSTNERQVKDDKQVELDNGHRPSELHRKTNTAEVHNSSLRCAQRIPSGDVTIPLAKPGEETHAMLLPAEYVNGVSCDPAPALVNDGPASAHGALDGVSSSMSCSSSRQGDLTFQYCGNSHSKGLESNKKNKEFKLNPGAKVFSPTFNNSRSATPPLAQTIAGITYMPSTSSMLPAQTEVGMGPFMPHSAVPVKVLPYTGIGDINTHPEPVARAHLLRYAGQHQTVPVGSTFVHPNSQPLMVGRMGQVMYMPLPQDLGQNGAAISPVFTRPLPTVSQVQIPKHQGNLPGQPLIHPPSVAGVQQLFAAPGPMPLMQPPLLANSPITVAGRNSLYPTKFS